MDFDDIFEKRNKHHPHYHNHQHSDHQWYDNDHDRGRLQDHDVRYGQRSPHGHENEFIWTSLVDRFKNNPRLRGITIVAGIIILFLLILLIILLIPLLSKIVQYLMQNGVKGILGEVSQFLDKLWNGNA